MRKQLFLNGYIGSKRLFMQVTPLMELWMSTIVDRAYNIALILEARYYMEQDKEDGSRDECICHEMLLYELPTRQRMEQRL